MCDPETIQAFALAVSQPQSVTLSNAEVYEMALQVEKFIKTLKDEFKASVKDEKVEGYHIDDTLVRKIQDIKEAFKLLDLPQEAFMGCCSVSIPKLETAYREINGGTKDEANKAVENTLGDIINISFSQKVVKND